MYLVSVVKHGVNLLFLCKFCAISNEFNSGFVCVLQDYISQRKDWKGVSTPAGWPVLQLKVDICFAH